MEQAITNPNELVELEGIGPSCKCGCGQRVQKGRKQPWNNFIYGHNRKNVKDTKRYRGNDYKQIGTGSNIKLEHRIIAEEVLGKPLPPSAVIHHLGMKYDNHLIVICENDAYHFLLHRRERAYRATGNSKMRKCTICKEWDFPENLYVYHGKYECYRHQSCNTKYLKFRRLYQQRRIS